MGLGLFCHPFLKLIQIFPPFSVVINLPRHSGREMSMRTWTLIKCPPSSSIAPMDFWTSPIVSQISSATFLVMKRTGMSWTWTQNNVVLKTKSRTGISELYLCNITRSLSKLQARFFSIRSISPKLSNTNSTRFSLWLRILNSSVDLHNCLKVLAMASMLMNHGIRNCAAMMNSPVRWSLCSTKPVFSLSNKVKWIHFSAKSSIPVIGKEQTYCVTLKPQKTKPH